MSSIEIKIHLDKYKPNIETALNKLTDSQIINRIWEHDHTVWKPNPAEITNRLGWLDIAERLQGEVARMTTLRERLRDENYTHVLLLGMGGSSLAPEVFAKTFGNEVGGLELAVLDSTDPGAVLAQAKRLNLPNTLFIVATKSGGTVENSFIFQVFL